MSRWRAEPFRLFFPLGVVLAWVGVGHWVLYATGASASYSCQLHGLIQVQAFLTAFALGFLFTALPRRTRSAPPTTGELAAAAGALVVTTAGALAERWVIAETAYVGLIVLLFRFAVGRLLGRGAERRPPATFVLIPLGLLHGLAGATLIILAETPLVPASAVGLAKLLIGQGVFLCFAVGIGGLVFPVVSGTPPPIDLGTSAREDRKVLAYAAAGVAIFATLVAEHAGSARLAPLARAAVVAVGLGAGAGTWRPPGRPGLHRRLVWLAMWLMPVGLAAAGLFPSYRVPALHVLFIGGFSLLAFGVATHVALGHLGLEEASRGHPRFVVVLAVAFLLAMLARVAADASQTYFEHLGAAAAVWIVGSAVWLAFLGPKLLAR